MESGVYPKVERTLTRVRTGGLGEVLTVRRCGLGLDGARLEHGFHQRRKGPDMLYFLIPRRYRPLARIAIGVVLLVLGIAGLGRIPIVIGAAIVVWGVVSGINRGRSGAYDDDRDSVVGR